MTISILGCGAYGMALATSFLEKKNTKLKIWSKFQEELDPLQKKYPNIIFDTNLKTVIQDTDLIVIAIPTNFLESVIKELKKNYLGEDILIASKGIDTEKQLFAYEIVTKYLENAPIGVISGGTFAIDMMQKEVMGLTLATTKESIKQKIKLNLENEFLKIQYSDDIIGTSICGALKNVMAIGFGILDGAGLPESSRFLFLTEAIYEIQYFIEKMNGNPNTIMSYAGLDDIMMTCTSTKSRNYSLGKMIGTKESLEKIEEYKQTTTIEGLGTSKSIYSLCQKKKIELPLSKIIYQILYENKDNKELVNYLKNNLMNC